MFTVNFTRSDRRCSSKLKYKLIQVLSIEGQFGGET
jgi:hypothetical protein